MQRYLTERLHDVDWVARVLSRSGGGSIVALTLRRLSVSWLLPSGGGGGGGQGGSRNSWQG